MILLLNDNFLSVLIYQKKDIYDVSLILFQGWIVYWSEIPKSGNHLGTKWTKEMNKLIKKRLTDTENKRGLGAGGKRWRAKVQISTYKTVTGI